MRISTKYFDDVEVLESDIIYFEDGIFGFEYVHKYVIMEFEKGSDNILCLQNIEDSELAFVLMNPFDLKSDYEPKLSDEDIKTLKIESDNTGVLYYVICVVKDTIAESTVNLKCPIVINPQNKMAKQIILDNSNYTFRHELRQFTEGES